MTRLAISGSSGEELKAIRHKYAKRGLAMSRRRRWVLVEIALAAAMIASMPVPTRGFGSPAFQGSDCSPYKLPKGATFDQTAASKTYNTIQIFYRTPDGNQGTLVVPFDAIPATCVDPSVQAVVVSAQKADKEVQASMCKFVGDVLTGRVQLPPEKAKYFDRKFAEEWYRKTCLSIK